MFKKSSETSFHSLKNEETQRPPSLSGAIKSRVREWLEDTDIHGLPNIARSQSLIIKVMWTVCFCLSSGACSFLVARSICGYLEYDVLSKYDMIYETPTTFPTVTVCNQNIFVTDEATDYVKGIMDMYGITFESFVDETNMTAYRNPGLQLRSLQSNANLLASVNLGTNYTDAFKKSLGLALDEFIISCEFEFVECSVDDFEWYFDATYGNCFRFGKSNPKQTSKVGPYDGLVMQLAVGLGSPESNYTLSRAGGAHIFIHNQSLIPSAFEGVDVAPGTSTSFIVSRQWSNKLPSPYNDCYDDLNALDSYDSVLYREIIKANLTYRQVDCFRLCYQKQAIANCGCLDLTVSSISGADPCHTSTEMACLGETYANFKVDDDCLAMCPLECDSFDLDLFTHFTSFPTETYARSMAQLSTVKARFPNQTTAITYDMLAKSFLEVKVYYEQTAYKLIEQNASLSLIDLIAALGGTLGLFLGVSFLSFVELVELTIDILILSYAYWRNHAKAKVIHVKPMEKC